ncbi:Pimeloyl-ACP methyl ester carboxylesterase [Fodinibius salinus]|uniref:Pimeloyl-ACP methyl ester carboxylesterase n=2 Tax=Fodinibius salinus TaxID=860790 RepID=A0A5D3YMA5_9BACT|nr:Pimeloyl-ACP methyl ester carboxylesterase [Fodinibius salinus]
MQRRIPVTPLRTIFPVELLKYMLFLWMLIAIPLIVSGQTQDPSKNQKKPAFTVEVYGSGAPVYMIPGLASSGDVWQGTVERLKDRYECHVFTLAGFAGKEPISRTPYLKTMRKELMDYIDAHGSGIVMGHSLGGFLSLWIAIANDSLVEKSIIVDSYPFLAALRQPGATEETVQFSRERMIQQMTQMDSVQFRRQQKNTLSTMISDEQNIQKALKWSMMSDRATIVNAMGGLMQTDLRDEISKIQTPTYIMVAGNISMNGQRLYSTKQVQQLAQEQYKNLSEKTISVAEDAKHFIMMDDPQWFYQTLEQYLDE